MSSALHQIFEPIIKYWVIIVAAVAIIWYLSGFAVLVQQLQIQQNELRVRIVALEDRQSKTDEKMGVQQLEVLTRLTRIEVLLEEARKK